MYASYSKRLRISFFQMNFFQKILYPYSRAKKDGNFFFDYITTTNGFPPKNILFYQKAFTHRSMNERDSEGRPISYERMEFLGDVMLNAIISHYLYSKVPDANEGYLTNMRSKIISREHLNEIGKRLNLIKYVKSNVSHKNFGENIYGNIFEALVGAVYLDRGFKYCEKFLQKNVIDLYVDIEKLEGKIISYKGLLIEWCQKRQTPLFFEPYLDNGNDSVKHFAVKLYINYRVVAKARATSKKKAEEKAAKRAYFSLQKQMNLPPQ